METTIITRLPLDFDEHGLAIVEFDFQALQEEYKNYYIIDQRSQMMTVTENFIMFTFRATLLPRPAAYPPVFRGSTRRYGPQVY